MKASFEINKGVNRSVEFKGIKAQYISYLAGGLIGLLLLFAVGYIAGLSLFVLIPGVATGGYFLFQQIGAMSKKYGRYGLMKKTAFFKLPAGISCRTRSVFLQLKNQSTTKK